MEITYQTTLDEISKHFHRVMCSCGAVIGEFHNKYCDVARCLECGDQAFVSECDKWNPDVWTGFWPGTIECIQEDLYCYWGPDYGRQGWVKCSADHPGARIDLNALALVRASK